MNTFALYVCAGRTASPAIDTAMQFAAWVIPGIAFIAAIRLLLEAGAVIRRSIRRRRRSRDVIRRLEEWANCPDNHQPRREDTP